MARMHAVYGILALVSVVALFALTIAGDGPLDGLTSDADCGDSLTEARVGRNLLELPNGNKYTDPGTGVVYYIWNKPTANSFEAKVNCTRMGMEQPDVTKPGDLFAVQYLSANFWTWVKTNGESPCTLLNAGLFIHGCTERNNFACALRKPLETCGKDSKGKDRKCGPNLHCCGGTTCCCASSTCCGTSICCHSGTKCCPGKLGGKPSCQHILVKC